MEPILSTKALQARGHNASVGRKYPADERFAEVKRAGEIMDVIKGRITIAEMSGRAESLGIASEIMNAPGQKCPAGEACVPFDYGRHTACRECNQVRDSNPENAE